jgi:hypothetical protein
MLYITEMAAYQKEHKDDDNTNIQLVRSALGSLHDKVPVIF